MVFNDTFNNISVISRWTILLLLEETGVSRKNRPAAVTDKFYQIKLYTLPWAGFKFTSFVLFIFFLVIVLYVLLRFTNLITPLVFSNSS
jgi:hypothetical protein